MKYASAGVLVLTLLPKAGFNEMNTRRTLSRATDLLPHGNVGFSTFPRRRTCSSAELPSGG